VLLNYFSSNDRARNIPEFVNTTCDGIVHLRDDNAELAEKSFQSAVTLDPNYVTAINNLGLAYMDMKMYDKAEQSFATAYRRDPSMTDALHNLGQVYMNLANYDKAAQTFRMLYQRMPNNPPACFLLGEALSKTSGGVPEAIGLFRKGLTIDQSSPDAHADLAELYLAVNDKAASLGEYREALKLDPGNETLKQAVEELSR